MENAVIQRKLNEKTGSRLIIDGVIGAKTTAVILRYQKTLRIPQTGEICPLTMRFLLDEYGSLSIEEQFVVEASRWVGVTEERNNSGQIINMFQHITGNKSGHSWCMSFLAYCVVQVIYYATIMGIRAPAAIKSGHCMTVWAATPAQKRSQKPVYGGLAIWNYEGTTNGHTGVVVYVGKDNMWTIEGNTSASNSSIESNGGGVFLKKRPLTSVGKMKLVGFIEL